MTFQLEGFVYLFAGLVIIFLYFIKKKGISVLSHDIIPEFDEGAFLDFKSLLETSYERTLYLGIAFLFLAYVTFSNLSFDIKAFCILAVIGVFIYNIPPRNKAMKILISSGISLKTIKSRGVRL
jgi:hypothetical protein